MNPHEPSRQDIVSPLKKEWGILLLLMLMLAALLGYTNGLGQTDRFIYDNLIKASPYPPSDQIVIIAIDNPSIASLGRWPWKRDVHARLFDILTQANAKAIGMDIIFSEPELNADNDALLANAIAKNQRTVLPVLIERTATGLQTVLPIAPLKEAVKNLGHIHFTFDVDGVVRNTYLKGNVQEIPWPQFALSVFNVGQGDVASTDNSPRATDKNSPALDSFSHFYSPAIFDSDSLEHIPFAGPPGHFPTVSYIDVLSGKISPAIFADKYVLIGATATGIASTFPTPVTSDHRTMSGLEINANILAGLIENRHILSPASWQIMLFTMIATLLALAACRYFSPVHALGLTLLLCCLIGMSSYFAFVAGIWIPPAAALLMVIATYPLWSWRRLEAALRYLSEEFSRLNQNMTIVLRPADGAVPLKNADYLDKQIEIIRLAANRSRDMHQFVIDNLNSMPDATLLLSQKGDLLMYNRVARRYFATLGFTKSSEPTLDAIFSNFAMPLESTAKHLSWRQILLHSQLDNEAVQVETRDLDGREFLIKSAPSRMADNSMLGWIVSLIDVTSLRAAERRREESLNFISHDMRVPQSSILALIQLQKNPATAFPLQEFLGRIEKSVETTLNLADNFVHLAKAESQSYQLQDADFSSMLADAADDMWAFAHSKGITIIVNSQLENHWLNADRSMLVRAIGNLLSNAIKFSPRDSRVVCTARPIKIDAQVFIICSISDQGKGMHESQHNAIFLPFMRENEQGRDGVGLGLAFVKMVIERHGGTIDVHSVVGEGSIFTISLPCVIEAGDH